MAKQQAKQITHGDPEWSSPWKYTCDFHRGAVLDPQYEEAMNELIGAIEQHYNG